MDEETKSEFHRIHNAFGQVYARLDKVDERLDRMDARMERMMAGIAQQFEAMQKYMDRRFNEVLEVMEIRVGPVERQVRDHERRLRRLEEHIDRSSRQ